jgi:hypothetical protein
VAPPRRAPRRDPRARGPARGWRRPPAAGLRLIRRGTRGAIGEPTCSKRPRPGAIDSAPARQRDARCGAVSRGSRTAARSCCCCSSLTASRATPRSALRSGCRSDRSGRPACAASTGCAERPRSSSWRVHEP